MNIMTASKRILICGLGSMGKRRLKLIRDLHPDVQIHGTDVRADRCREVAAEYKIETYGSYDDAFKRAAPFAVFVCTAPKSHSEFVIHALENNAHTFSEINLDSRGYKRILQASEKHKRVAFLSSTFLYREEIKWIIQRARGENNLSYRYHVGQYLPDWHPWEKYTDFFVSDADQNACKELLAIELPWLTKAFGDVERFKLMAGRKSGLELDYDDTLHILFEHNSGIQGSVTLDCVCAKGVRKFDMYNHGSYIEWGGTPDTLVQYNKESKQMTPIPLYPQVKKDDAYDDFIIENPYVEEIISFFDAIAKEGISTPLYTYEQNLGALDLISQIQNNHNERTG